MKAGNNHAPTVYNETDEIKKSLKRLTIYMKSRVKHKIRT